MKVGVIGNGFVGEAQAFAFSLSNEVLIYDVEPKRSFNTFNKRSCSCPVVDRTEDLNSAGRTGKWIGIDFDIINSIVAKTRTLVKIFLEHALPVISYEYQCCKSCFPLSFGNLGRIGRGIWNMQILFSRNRKVMEFHCL